MKADEGPTRAAPAHFPYDHLSLAWVWEQEERLNAAHEAAKVEPQAEIQAVPSEPEPEPLAPLRAPPPPRKIPRVTDAERLEMISAEKAFERFMRGER
jgi:hypothetical protein